MEGVNIAAEGENVWEVGGFRVSGTRSKVPGGGGGGGSSHQPSSLVQNKQHGEDAEIRRRHPRETTHLPLVAFGNHGERTTATQLSPHSLQPLRQLFPGNAGLHRRAAAETNAAAAKSTTTTTTPPTTAGLMAGTGLAGDDKFFGVIGVGTGMGMGGPAARGGGGGGGGGVGGGSTSITIVSSGGGGGGGDTARSSSRGEERGVREAAPATATATAGTSRMRTAVVGSAPRTTFFFF